jgi:hypothetical protein
VGGAALPDGILAAACHRGEGVAHAGGGAVREPRVHRNRSEQVRVDRGEDRGHGAACGQAGYEDAASVNRPGRCCPHEFADDRDDRRRLSGAASLVLGQEPVPAALRVVAARLLGIDRNETMAVGGLVHQRRGGEARRVLRAAMQHADERDGGLRLHARRPMDQCAPGPPGDRESLLVPRAGFSGSLSGAEAPGEPPGRAPGFTGPLDHRAVGRVQLAPVDGAHLAHYINRSLGKAISQEPSLARSSGTRSAVRSAAAR